MNTTTTLRPPGGQAHEPGPSSDLAAMVRAEVRAELQAQGQVVSGASYQSALRAASARASIHVQGVGDVSTAAGSQPINDHAPLVRQARGRAGWRIEGDPRDGYQRQVGALAVRGRLARLAEEQEAVRQAEIGRQVQARQLQALHSAGAFEVHQVEDRHAQHRQQLQAEGDAWAASVANSQAEGARRADAQAQAAIQAHTSS